MDPEFKLNPEADYYKIVHCGAYLGLSFRRRLNLRVDVPGHQLSYP